jgi:hypothetical protein
MFEGVEQTGAVDALVVACKALNAEEQDDLYNRLGELRLQRMVSAETELGKYLRSMKRAAKHAGCKPEALTVTQYRAAIRDGVELEPLSRLLKFLGSWKQAQEAFELAKDNSLRAVEARLAKRQLRTKVWRYSKEALRSFMAEAVDHYGRVPMASELDDYRERRIELARAQGQDPHLPASGAYRRRWGTYEKACLALGYTPDQVAERLERGVDRART